MTMPSDNKARKKARKREKEKRGEERIGNNNNNNNKGLTSVSSSKVDVRDVSAVYIVTNRFTLTV